MARFYRPIRHYRYTKYARFRASVNVWERAFDRMNKPPKPKVGQTKEKDGKSYRFNENRRWERIKTPAYQPSYGSVPSPNYLQRDVYPNNKKIHHYGLYEERQKTIAEQKLLQKEVASRAVKRLQRLHLPSSLNFATNFIANLVGWVVVMLVPTPHE
jgi:hypothetical protein